MAGRRVGGAVERNRAKRRLRAVVRSEGVPAGLDLVLVAKADAVRVPFPLLLQEYRRLQERLVRRTGVTP